jgi:pimeloyl-ACP methyl ester carboxylesterase
MKINHSILLLFALVTNSAQAEAFDFNKGDSKTRSHSGESPLHPPEPVAESSYEFFTVDTGTGLDTGCTYRNGGPLKFSIEIDRFVGAVNSDGFLKEHETLIKNKVISSKAKLIMPAFDVDSSASPEPPIQPEIDKVFFNGEELKPFSGQNDTWIMNEFEIPIEKIKFPQQRGQDGKKPTPAENEIRVDIDTGNPSEEVWCTAVDWAQLQFQVVAPILLVHGITGNPATWEVADALDLLNQRRIPYDHNIQLAPNGSVAANGQQLAQIVKDKALSFGAKKVHLVVHSKGGLDSRRFLSAHYNPKEVQVLSLHTLSTPHHGSVHADISIVQRTINDPQSDDTDVQEYLDSDWWANNVAGQGPQRPGIDDLQTATVRTFNAANKFPASVKLYTYGADADLNNDGAITDAEAAPLLTDIMGLMDAAEVGSLLYRLLRDVASITVTRNTNLLGLNEWHVVTPNPTGSPQENDLSVTDTSSQHPSQTAHFGPLDRNHSNIKDGASLTTVLERISADFPVK